MIKLTKEQQERIMEQTRSALDRAEAGMCTRDIMAHIYMEGLENKTLEQGRMMADAILESVAAFDSQYSKAKDDLDGWLDESLAALVADMTPAEKCTCWLKIAAAVTAANSAMEAGGSFDRNEILASIEEMTVSEEQATTELEAELYTQAKAAIESSNVMPAALAAQDEVLEAISSADDAAGLLLDLGSREIDFRAIASMNAYVNIKNGTFENIPVDMKLEQVTTLVCTEVEQMRILAGVETGKMPLETAKLLLSILGTVAIICLLPTVLEFGLLLTVSLTSGLAMIPVGAAVLLLMLYGMSEAFDWWNRQADRIAENASVQIQQISRGTKKMMAYLQDTILPGAMLAIHTAWEQIKSIFFKIVSRSENTSEQNTNEEFAEEAGAETVEWVPAE